MKTAAVRWSTVITAGMTSASHQGTAVREPGTGIRRRLRSAVTARGTVSTGGWEVFYQRPSSQDHSSSSSDIDPS